MPTSLKKYNSAFTLIELLVTVAIMAALSAGLIGATVSYTKNARDSKRKTEISQYRTALETYANKKNGYYPSRTASVSANGVLCADLGLSASSCAADPVGGTYSYQYISNGSGGGGATATVYAIYAVLEKPTTNNYFVMCSNGSTLTLSGAPTVANCQ